MKSLVAETLANDPRIDQAKKLLQSAVADRSKELVGVRAPDPDRIASSKQMIEQFNAIRAGALYFPYLGSGIGHGALVELADGSVKYDMISGIGVHYLGHSHPALIAAGVDAAIRDTIMQGNLQQNVESVAMSQSLLDLANRGEKRFGHCFLTTSGSMANENSLKIILQKQTPASRVLAFEHAFAGRTMAMSMITDKAAYRTGLPKVLDVDYLPFFDYRRPKESTAETIKILKSHIARFPKLYAAMCMELIQGEGGYYPGDRDFFRAVIDVLKENNIAVWCDEIQTFGRTTHPFAFQHFDLDQYVDVVSVGKLTQVCASIFTDAFKPKPGLISQTFTGSTSAIFAASAIMDVMKKEKLFGEGGKIDRLYKQFVGRLEKIHKAHPDWITGPWGMGAMIACSIFDGGDAVTKQFLLKLFDNGVVSFVAGSDPARVRFLMPVPVVSEADVEAVCDIIEKTLAEVAHGRSATHPA
ncbi:MAG TPA: aminotransferase class III-fold pyridoxal phosphate-dependent enzyme [Tepidisphaeraceae bacterium]|jgi:acetylornithine aminotransferase